MSANQRPVYDPAKVAETMAALTGWSEVPEPKAAPKPVPKLDALKVVDLALAALRNAGATWTQDGPFRRVSAHINDDAFITYQEPFTGGTLGPDYKLEIREGGATVFLAKWYSEEDERADRLVFCFQPGQWLANLAESPSREAHNP